MGLIAAHKRTMSFEDATALYQHRYTAEHVPRWALVPHGGQYYAPHYRSDREWYDNTLFPGESAVATRAYCFSTGQTWPFGKWLDDPA